MAISIQSSKDNADDKTVSFTIAYDGKDYKWHGDMPKDADAQDYLDAKEDMLKVEILRKLYPEAEVPQLKELIDDYFYEDKSELESFEAWVSAGAKNAEVKQEIPAVKAKAAVYEDVEVSPAGERQVELSEEEEITKTVIEKSESSGKYLEKEVTETVVKKIPQYEEVPLYSANGKAKKDEDGNAVMHKIPKMEEYEAVTERRLVSEAVKAVAKKELIIKPEAVIEKKAWVDSH